MCLRLLGAAVAVRTWFVPFVSGCDSVRRAVRVLLFGLSVGRVALSCVRGAIAPVLGAVAPWWHVLHPLKLSI